MKSLLIFAALTAPPFAANAQETASSPLRQAVFAQQLFRLGQAQKDPLAMVAAANLAASVAFDPKEIAGETFGEALPDQTDSAKSPIDAAAMQDSALKSLDPDETLALLLRENTRAARLLPGATLHSSANTLRAGQSTRYTVPFDGAVLAELGVIGDGDSRLALTVTDAENAVICATATASDAAACSFTPTESAFYTVTISNPGPGTNSYFLLSN